MASDIEWTDETWNPVVGCRRVSPGCEHCYAERVAHRGMSKQHKGLTVVGKQGIRWTGEARFVPEALAKPLHWRKPRRVFVNSMSDLFHDDVTMEQIAAVFGVMAACPHLTFQVLTKRPARMLEFFRWVAERAEESQGWRDALQVCLDWAGSMVYMEASHGPHPFDEWPLPNVWIGVSVEDQRRADERIPLLLQAPAALRFLSVEPLLEAVDLAEHLDNEYAPRDFGGAMAEEIGPSIDWVIVGGESGPGARPFDVAWARSIIEQCREAGVPVFVKQLGARVVDSQYLAGRFAPEDKRSIACAKDLGMDHVGFNLIILRDRKGGDMSEWPEDLRVRQMPEVRRGQ